MKGALLGVLGLIALQVLTSSTLSGLPAAVAYPAQLVARWLDPTVPLIGSASSSAAGSAAPAATPASQQASQQGAPAAGIGSGSRYVTNT